MEIIERYFPELTDKQKEQFKKLEFLYSAWNEKINVISRKDIEQLYLRHVLHSLAIAKFIQFTDNSEILDAGTGGGFPGIPLAIMFPRCRFLLVDSIGKKIKVVQAIIEALGLVNCASMQVRAEELKGKFDFVVSRAVTTLPVFISWTRKLISPASKNTIPNGIIYLKGGYLTEKLNIPFEKTVINISDYFDNPFFESKKLFMFISDNVS